MLLLQRQLSAVADQTNCLQPGVRPIALQQHLLFKNCLSSLPLVWHLGNSLFAAQAKAM